MSSDCFRPRTTRRLAVSSLITLRVDRAGCGGPLVLDESVLLDQFLEPCGDPLGTQACPVLASGEPSGVHPNLGPAADLSRSWTARQSSSTEMVARPAPRCARWPRIW